MINTSHKIPIGLTLPFRAPVLTEIPLPYQEEDESDLPHGAQIIKDAVTANGCVGLTLKKIRR